MDVMIFVISVCYFTIRIVLPMREILPLSAEKAGYVMEHAHDYALGERVMYILFHFIIIISVFLKLMFFMTLSPNFSILVELLL